MANSASSDAITPVSRVDHASPILSEREAAKFLGVSPATLQAWRSTGRVRLAFVKLGRSVRYRLADLVEFVEAHTRSSTS